MKLSKIWIMQTLESGILALLNNPIKFIFLSFINLWGSVFAGSDGGAYIENPTFLYKDAGTGITYSCFEICFVNKTLYHICENARMKQFCNYDFRQMTDQLNEGISQQKEWPSALYNHLLLIAGSILLFISVLSILYMLCDIRMHTRRRKEHEVGDPISLFTYLKNKFVAPKLSQREAYNLSDGNNNPLMDHDVNV